MPRLSTRRTPRYAAEAVRRGYVFIVQNERGPNHSESNGVVADHVHHDAQNLSYIEQPVVR